MKRIIIIFIVFLSFSGCKKGGTCCSNYSTYAFLKYQDGNGNDLLNPKTPNALSEQDIEVYVLRKDVRVKLLNVVVDAPKSFKIRDSSTEGYFMQFYFDIAKESFSGKRVTMFLVYKNGGEDKLVGEFNDSDGPNILLQNVWINDVAKGQNHLPAEAFVIKK